MAAQKFESKLAGKTLEEIKELAEDGVAEVRRMGGIPANTPQSFAIAAMVRLEKETKANRWGRDQYPRRQNDGEDQAA